MYIYIHIYIYTHIHIIYIIIYIYVHICKIVFMNKSQTHFGWLDTIRRPRGPGARGRWAMSHEAFPGHVQTRGQMCYGQKLVICNGIFTGICNIM